jgi:hypothetical protein
MFLFILQDLSPLSMPNLPTHPAMVGLLSGIPSLPHATFVTESTISYSCLTVPFAVPV